MGKTKTQPNKKKKERTKKREGNHNYCTHIDILEYQKGTSFVDCQIPVVVSQTK